MVWNRLSCVGTSKNILSHLSLRVSLSSSHPLRLRRKVLWERKKSVDRPRSSQNPAPVAFISIAHTNIMEFSSLCPDRSLLLCSTSSFVNECDAGILRTTTTTSTQHRMPSTTKYSESQRRDLSTDVFVFVIAKNMRTHAHTRTHSSDVWNVG